MLRRLVLATAILPLLLLGCRSRQHAQRTVAHRAASNTTTENGSFEWEDDGLPSRDEYAGSEACRDCHEKKYNAWKKDWHSRALAPAKPETIVARYDGTHYAGASSEAWMKRENNRYVMRTRDRAGELRDFDVEWLIGGKRMQDSVTVFPDGRWQVLPVYFHVTGRGEWVDYNEAKQGVVGPDHPFFWANFRRTANKECLDCHTTGLDVRYDESAKTWRTTFVDAGVACEACHGPGARHAQTKEKSDIIHPLHLRPERQLAVCGQCHTPREPLYPLLDSKHRFRPGQPYRDSYAPLVITDGFERSGEYFADGRPSSSTFEYAALLQSRCYRIGRATCLTCHTAPHESHTSNDIKLLDGAATHADATCRTCHENVFEAGREHTKHAAAAAQSCVACHMPPVLSSVLDHFADHTIDVPVPLNTVKHGVPNACNVCHTRETPEAMTGALARMWPGSSARQQRRIRLADAIDEKTAAMSGTALRQVVSDASEAPTLRGAAAVILAQRFRANAVPTILPLLRDRDELLRARAIEALGYAGDRSVVDEIAHLVSDPSVRVRETAALTLDAAGDSRGRAALEKLAADPATSGLVRPHFAIAVDAIRAGDSARARSEAQRTIELMPYFADARVLLADLDAREGHLDRARASLESALQFDPQNRGARERLQAMGVSVAQK